jgi:hypothetical protein
VREVAKIKLCRECGVPLMVSKGQTWKDNGTIVQTKDPDHRMSFFEPEMLNGIFSRLESILGVPIDKIVIESKGNEAREYVEKLLPPIARKLARHVGMGMVADNLSRNGRALGFGDVALVDRRRKGDADDYVAMRVRNPHSLMVLQAEMLGAWEAIDGRDNQVRYEQADGDEYLLTVSVGSHPIELREHLKFRTYSTKPGDIAYDRCSTCGVPLKVAQYRWDPAEGTITHPATGTRIAVTGVKGIDAILDALEAELGDAIPPAVVDAQRRHMKESMGNYVSQGENTDYRTAIAFRGLGNLTRFELNPGRLSVTLENACMHLMMVGMTQALFELAMSLEKSSCEYELTADGDLNMEISAPG